MLYLSCLLLCELGSRIETTNFLRAAAKHNCSYAASLRGLHKGTIGAMPDLEGCRGILEFRIKESFHTLENNRKVLISSLLVLFLTSDSG